MNPLIARVGAVLARFGVYGLLALVLWGWGFLAGTLHQTRAQAKQDEHDAAVAQAAAASAAEAAASGVAGVRADMQGIARRIGRATATAAVYSDCRHPAGVRDAINDALAGRRSADQVIVRASDAAR